MVDILVLISTFPLSAEADGSGTDAPRPDWRILGTTTTPHAEDEERRCINW